VGANVAFLFAMTVAAQPRESVVSAEAPVVNGNAVVAKQRALADGFRQAVERAFADLLKEGGGEGQPLSGGLAQLKASFANRGQRFVRSYRMLEEDESNGRLRVQIDADVDTALLRREMERVRGTTAAEPANVGSRPVGPAVVVGGDMTAEVGATVVKGFGAAGLLALSAGVRDEASLLAAAAQQVAQPLFLAVSTFDEGAIRGASRVSVRCELRARLLPAGQGARPAILDRTLAERGFAGDEAGARQACIERAAENLARQLSVSLRPTPAAARYLTMDLDVVEPAALMGLLQFVKRLGAVSAAEVRQVTTNQAEIRVFTRMSGRELEAALVRDVAGRLFVTETKPPSDHVTLQVRLAQASEPPPGAGADPPATKP
jgi:hypothetical protein